ncbi:hypothetical protein GGR56DRAFT_629441 [Xylariaceae sp. FL0804]|nr:hypothetical protein GGR56DRAFT_629441 [Xylariaceae sp. FL0804]
MSTEDYAPKSPDLSSFYSAPEPAPTSAIHNPEPYYTFQAPTPAPAQAQTAHPRAAAASPTYDHPPHQYHDQLHQYERSSYQKPPSALDDHSHNHNQNGYLFGTYSPRPPIPHQTQQYLSSPPPHYAQAHQQQSSFHHQPPTSALPSYYQPYGDSAAASTSFQPPPAQAQAQPFQNSHQAPLPNQPPGSIPPAADMPPRKAAQASREAEIMPSPVRTKFPTARIKRIMQADEEVGKVAQQTPIAVGKALELFMVQLVTKSAAVARERNSKRITAPMLKQAIDSANEWDFLQDIVAKVSEEKEGARSAANKAKPESDTDDEAEAGAGAGEPRKRGRGGGRKKKAPA